MSTYVLDTSHANVGFSVRHLMISKVHGRFTGVKATLETGATPSVKAEVDLSTIDTREEKRDGHLRSADFFDVANHPTMTFVSTGVSGDITSEFTLKGDLTIRGVTRPLELKVEALGAAKDPWGNERLGYEAKGSFNRSDFGITWNAALEAGGVVVSDKVDVALDLEFIKQA